MSRRMGVAALATLACGGSAVVALGDVITPNPSRLSAVGPTSGENGFPVWYKDDKGVRLEPCIDANDANCAAAAALPDPSQPMSFPDNFPDELFYQLANSVITLPGGGKAVSDFNLEGAFVNGPVKAGDQMVFGRVRFFYKGLQANKTYRITHPYGVDEVTADGSGAVRFTEDTGTGRNVFGEALNSRIAPFLKWDTGAPAGYLGDGATLHAITGSPTGTNFVHIQGLTGPKGQPDGSLDVQSDQFTVMGKLATTGGVGVDRVTYSRSSGGTGGMLDVLANSELGPQSIEVSGAGVDTTRLRGEAGHYGARVPFTGTPPATVTVTNVGDVPASKKSATVTDAVTGSAVYDADALTLTINADSSDKASPPALTAAGYGPLNGSGVLVAGNLSGPPADVTVTSAAGGSVTLPVAMTGAGFNAIPVQAFAGTDQQVLTAATVTLDGGASTGPVTGYDWTQTAGPAVTLSGTGSRTPTFTAPDVAPATEATLSFQLTVTGAGGPSTNTVSVKVLASAPSVTANAGPDQAPAVQDSVVTLDGSASANAVDYAWTQTAGPSVALTGAGTSKPTFRMPKGSQTLTFQLKATNAGGSSTDTVSVAPKYDTLTISRASYTRATATTGEWRVEGNSTVFGPTGVSVTVHKGATLAGTVIGKADVDALGAWKLRIPASTVPSDTRVSLESTSGGTLLNQVVTVK
jgi:hypothetical protein